MLIVNQSPRLLRVAPTNENQVNSCQRPMSVDSEHSFKGHGTQGRAGRRGLTGRRDSKQKQRMVKICLVAAAAELAGAA